MIHVTIQQISSFVDDQLAEGSADLVRQHLSECSECHARLDAIRRMDAALSRALAHDPGEAAFRRIEAEVESEIRGAVPAGTPVSRPMNVTPTPRPQAPVTSPPRTARTAVPSRVASTPPNVSSRGAVELERSATPSGRRREPKHSSAGLWITTLSLALIAGSAGVVVSHSGTVQSWLDGLISKPNFKVASPTGPTDTLATGAPGVVEDSIWTSDELMAATVPPPPSSTTEHPLPSPPPRLGTASSREDDTDWEGEETGTVEPQTMMADEVLADSPDPGSSANRVDPYESLRPDVREVIREAERQDQMAVFHPMAEQFDRAATLWERAIQSMNGPEQITARGRLADARYKAWEAAPTAARHDAAEVALRSYLLYVRAGTERESTRSRLTKLGSP